MRFKMVTLSEKEVHRVAGNAGSHADQMARELTDRWRSRLPEGQTVIDVHQLQVCVGEDLFALREKIRAIEDEHLDRIQVNQESRGVRDVAAARLRGRLIAIQRLVDGAYGPGTSLKVFGEKTVVIPTDAFELRRVAKRARRNLMDEDLVLGDAQLEGVEIAPKSLVGSFEAPLATLDDVYRALEASEPAFSESLERKQETLAKLQRQAGIAARFLEALYVLAGHEGIARRVRLSSHRSQGGDGGDDGSGGQTADGEAGPAAGEATADGTAGEASVEAGALSGPAAGDEIRARAAA